MREFTYVIPHSLQEAAAAAARPDTIVKAAGLDLVDRMKERLVTPKEVVNLLPLGRELAGVTVEADGGLSIGAMTTLTQLAEHEALATPALAGLREAAAITATPLIRNRATVAGNLLQFTRCWYVRSEAHHCLHGGRGPVCLAMNGDNRYHSVMGYVDCARVHPSNLAPALLALDAEYSTRIAGPAGKREERRKLGDLFPTTPKAEAAEHTLLPGEIVTAIHVPKQPAAGRSWYSESREKLSFDWATTACAVRLEIDGGIIRAARLVLGAVAPVPVQHDKAAALLVGQQPGDELFRRDAEAAFADAVPLSHNAYKVPVGKAIVREALHAALSPKAGR
ncbi:MAG: FAD binding domain-containing protein [Planctomycetes bacterium]|nr:FAD binding domain-containing protein [Planctomycetota bacterium]